MTDTHKRTVYLIQRGWINEDKRTGHGDGEILEETFTPSLREAESAFWRFVAKDGRTNDRGSYWARATVNVYACDDNDDVIPQRDANGNLIFTGQAILEFRSPIPEAGR
jgi:hypothetical protein